MKFRVKDLKPELETETFGSNGNTAHLFLEDAWFGSQL